MKIALFLYILILPIGTLASPSQKELNELSKRLKLYGLEQDEITDSDSSQNKVRPPNFQYQTKVIENILNQVFETQLPRLESRFGKCGQSSCIKDNGEYQEVQLPQTNTCLAYPDCGFYKCMEEKYSCSGQREEYLTKYAFKACKRYTKKLEQKVFSQRGYDWVNSVMYCLQDKLVEDCEVKGNCQNQVTAKKTCSYIRNSSYNFHYDCYLNAGPGICKLPLRDKINIWKTVKPFMGRAEFKQASRVILACIRRGL